MQLAVRREVSQIRMVVSRDDDTNFVGESGWRERIVEVWPGRLCVFLLRKENEFGEMCMIKQYRNVKTER